MRGDNAKVHAFYQSLGYYEQETRDLCQMARRPRADAVTGRFTSGKAFHDHFRPRPRQGRPRPLRRSLRTLKTTTFEYRRANGEWQTQTRETYDRGNGATLLPYNLAQRTVVLVRQFRYPAYVNGYDDLMIEAAAGLLDNDVAGGADSRRGRGGNRLSAWRRSKRCSRPS